MDENLKNLQKATGNMQMNFYYKLLEFIGFIITTIAIVAGFGFTAMGEVKNIIFFLLGEFFLFIAIGLGVYLILKNLLYTLEDLKKLRKDITERKEIKNTPEEKTSYKKIYLILFFWGLGGIFILISFL